MSRSFAALGPEWEQPLAEFLRALEAAGDARGFRPHPFTREEIARLARRQGKDVYCLLVEGDRVVAYGMLRGWDEGYEVPSLGIAVHPDVRRRGVGRAMMEHLHGAARERGAARVRLRVLADNLPALSLYERMGYRFEASEPPYLVGFIDV